MSYTGTGQGTNSANLSGTDFSYQALTNSQATLKTNSDQDTTLTFASPVSNLLLYAQYWRGAGSSCGGSGVYTFVDSTPTIKSGFTGVGTGISGNTLTVTTANFAYGSGILSFAGPLTTLTINPDCTAGSGNGFITVATDDTPPSLPGTPVSASILNFNQPAVTYSEEIITTE